MNRYSGMIRTPAAQDEVSNSELISKSVALAKVVKDLDPNAEIYGPAFWGILPCVQAGSGDNFKDPDWEAVKDSIRGIWITT